MLTLIVLDGAKVVDSSAVLAVRSSAAFGIGESNRLLIPSFSSARLPTTHVRGCLLSLGTGPGEDGNMGTCIESTSSGDRTCYRSSDEVFASFC